MIRYIIHFSDLPAFHVLIRNATKSSEQPTSLPVPAPSSLTAKCIHIEWDPNQWNEAINYTTMSTVFMITFFPNLVDKIYCIRLVAALPSFCEAQ